MGKPRDEVLSYPLPFIYAYFEELVARHEKIEKPETKDGWTQRGNKRTKTVTSAQALAKVRSQKGR